MNFVLKRSKQRNIKCFLFFCALLVLSSCASVKKNPHHRSSATTKVISNTNIQPDITADETDSKVTAMSDKTTDEVEKNDSDDKSPHGKQNSDSKVAWYFLFWQIFSTLSFLAIKIAFLVLR